MFGIGTTELLFILVIALVVLGPSKLPQIARSLGKGLAEFRRVTTDVKRTIEAEADQADFEEKKKKVQQEMEAKRATQAREAKASGEAADEAPVGGEEKKPQNEDSATI